MIENGLQSQRRRGPKTVLNNLIESFGFVAIGLAGLVTGGGIYLTEGFSRATLATAASRRRPGFLISS
jgi:hypothetical protein